jgi:hypothetical protein
LEVLLFNIKTLTHDEAIKKLFLEYRNADKKRYTDFFLSELSDSKFNSGLYVYASMKTFPKHSFTTNPDNVSLDIYSKWNDEEKMDHHRTEPCCVCSAYRQDISENVYEDKYYFIAGIPVDVIYEKLYVMQRINRSKKILNITEYDFTIFKEILSYLKNAEPETSIRDIHKQIKKSLLYKSLINRMKIDGIGIEEGVSNAASNKIQAIIETLGICGILQTVKHKAPFYEYINLSVAPRTSRSSYWAYPVDFWKGKDGINKEAFDYWFGDYIELTKM